LSGAGHKVSVAKSIDEAIALLSGGADFDLVLSDRGLAETEDRKLVKTIKENCADAAVVLINANGTIENNLTAIRTDSDKYLTESLSMNQIQHVIEHELEVKELRSQNEALLKVVAGVPLVESRSRSFRALIERARQAATSEAIVLLTGETGVGKNVLARQIHEWSPRRKGPFATLKCATVSESLLESELFGCEANSLNPHAEPKAGRLEAANGGTLFLDEVGDLSLNLQTKVLRFLEDGSFERGGDDLTTTVDTRIIVASNRDLTKKVSAGEFRSDLYYRLNVVSLHVPPLREHMEDLMPLAERLLAEAVSRNRRSGLEFSVEAKKALTAYTWPGNVRELRNVIERAVVLSRGNLIDKTDLPEAIFGPLGEAQSYVTSRATLDQIEEEHIRRVLAQTDSREDAAATLGIGVATLWRKRRRYHIE
jgi:two-component system, NtrC family, response regulator AlgB